MDKSLINEWLSPCVEDHTEDIPKALLQYRMIFPSKLMARELQGGRGTLVN